MSNTPDYESLAKLLPNLRNLVDACGEVTLTAEEAAKIQSLGFAVESGRWKCPPLPPHLTRDNPLLEPLSAGWDEQPRHPEVPHTESSKVPPAACQPDSEVHLAPKHSVKTVDVPPRSCEAKLPVQLSGKEPNWERIEEAASKIEEVLKRAGKPVRKRRLQQLLWRYPATVFNAALGMLLRRQRIISETRQLRRYTVMLPGQKRMPSWP